MKDEKLLQVEWVMHGRLTCGRVDVGHIFEWIMGGFLAVQRSGETIAELHRESSVEN